MCLADLISLLGQDHLANNSTRAVTYCGWFVLIYVGPVCVCGTPQVRWQSKEIHFGNNVSAPTSRFSRALAGLKSELIMQAASGAILTTATTTERPTEMIIQFYLGAQMQPSAPTQSLFKPNWQLSSQTRFGSLFSWLAARC